MSTVSGIAPGKLPLRLFTRGTEPVFDKSFSYRSGLENLPDLSHHIPSEELEQIRDGPLGVLLRFYESGFLWSAKLVHELLAHQLATKKKYEFWTLCGGQPIRFSMKEFKMITRLNCDPLPMDIASVDTDPEFYGLLGLSEDRQPCFNMVKEKISCCSDWSSVDRIRLVYLLLVYRFLLASAPGKQVESDAHVLVLDREKFEAYPWGRIAFVYLMESIQKATDDSTRKTHNSYSCFGFVQVLQVWAYEAVPVFGELFGNRKEGTTDCPPLLRWNGSRKRVHFDLPVRREPVVVNYLLDNTPGDLFEDESEDEQVDNMFFLVRGRKDKVFEKCMWEDQGKEEGPGLREVSDHGESSQGNREKKRKKTQETAGWNKELKEYFDCKMAEICDKIQGVADVVNQMDARLVQVEDKVDCFIGLDERVEKLEKKGKGKEAPMADKEDESQKLTACSSKPGRKKPFIIPTLKDYSVEDLPSEDETVNCKMDDAKIAEEMQSSGKTLSETSSTRDRNMMKQMNTYAAKVVTMVKKSPKLEKRKRKVPPKLKSPFKSTTAITKMIAFRPSTVYDPFELVDATAVNELDEWLTHNRMVNCAQNTKEEGQKFFAELRRPTTHISDAHIDAGMTLFRRRSLMSPCPYRDGRVAFMDSGFAVAIGHNYDTFLKDPKNYTWKSGAADYYTGVLPLVGSTNKQFGKDVDDIYTVININGNHWVSLAISIPNRSIHVYDSIAVLTKDEVIKGYVRPYAHMLPYMLQAFSSEKQGMSLAKYSISRPLKIPQNDQSGDCGIYALKYIECLALGCEFKGLCDTHIQRIRAKLAAEIFVESKDTGFY